MHNYKVAGTSVRDALQPYAAISFRQSPLADKPQLLLGMIPRIYSNNFPGHISAKALKEKLPAKVFNSYFKFGFVRNPWDWQVSLYRFMLKLEDHHQHELIKSMKSFDEYIDWRINHDLHLQKDFFYDEQGTLLIDYVGKLETLNDDFQDICDKIGITASLGHLNQSRQDSFLKYYNPTTIALVAEAFREDVETFGYSIPKL